MSKFHEYYTCGALFMDRADFTGNQEPVKVKNSEIQYVDKEGKNVVYVLTHYCLDGSPENIVAKAAIVAATTIASAEQGQSKCSDEEMFARVKELVKSIEYPDDVKNEVVKLSPEDEAKLSRNHILE